MNPQFFLLLETFLPSLVQKQLELEITLLETKKSRITNLVSQLIPLQENLDQFQQMHAPMFNVFGLLRYGHYETRLHTPFLCALLHPKGNHQLGSRFLELLVNELFENTISYSEMSNFQLIEELSVGEYGQIDIYLSFHYKKQHYCISIENKINATDQRDQLKRYYSYMDDHYPSAIKKLVYLSKSGKYPSEESLTNELMNEYLSKNILHLKSYKTDIIRWLDQITNDSIPEVVKHTLSQYKKTINAFKHD